ncbi:cytochrome c oxidase assembly factor like protein [Tanacetum coccineum]
MNPPPPSSVHKDDAGEEDESVKQLQQCSFLYLSLQDCLVNSNRNWKACQKGMILVSDHLIWIQDKFKTSKHVMREDNRMPKSTQMVEIRDICQLGIFRFQFLLLQEQYDNKYTYLVMEFIYAGFAVIKLLETSNFPFRCADSQ